MKHASIGVIVAASLALGGCKALGLTDESAKDWSTYTTKPGTYVQLDAPQKVKVEAFKTVAAAGGAPKVALTLKNEGESYAFFSVDVEFGFPAPEGSFAPYIPDFQSVDIEDFKKGDSKTIEVPAGQDGTPYFARISPISGADVRMTTGRENSVRGQRRGTMLLGNKVEVVDVGGDLSAEKPVLTYTLENVDEKGAEVGNLKYMVQFYKDGKLLDLPKKFSFFRPVGKALGKKGSTVVVEIAGLEDITGVAGAKPVLRVKQ